MKDTLKPGLTHTHRFTVTNAKTVSSIAGAVDERFAARVADKAAKAERP